MRSRLSGFLALALILGSVRAYAYEFEIDATSIGQGYQLVWFRPNSGDVILNRRRFTQSLRLHVWDILTPRRDPGYPDRAPKKAPFDMYFTSSLRFDNDFGGYTQGEITAGTETDPATRLVPELQNNDKALDVLYAYLGGRDVGGFVDWQLGRQMRVDTLDWYSFDGLAVRARTPVYLAVDVHAGTLVRSDIAGLLASPTHDPDGTSSRFCSVFDESTGMWSSPYAELAQPPQECKQKKQVIPVVGVGLETEDLNVVKARLAYRRALSRTPTGYLPRDAEGNPPAWGINEEKLSLDARLNFLEGGIVPFGAARWNFLVGQIDEAEAGVRLAAGDHGLTPEYTYSYPSWDGDSIFWVFSQFGYHDVRATYDWWPEHGGLRLYGRAFGRRFQNTVTSAKDENSLGAGEAISERATSVGAGSGVKLAVGPSGLVRVDAMFEDGFGGKRFGGDASTRLRLSPWLETEGRLTAYRFDEDLISGLKGTTYGAQAGGRWIMAEGIALHLIVEENVNKFYSSQLRVFAILDLAFRPEI
jgi:hypothetical protein